MSLQNHRIRPSRPPVRRSFMAQPFKHPSSGIYYLRRKVPAELRAVLGREFKRSLKTSDAAEAKRRHAAAWTDSEAMFAAARAQVAGQTSLGTRDVQVLAARWFRQEAEKMEQSGNFVHELIVGTPTLVERGTDYDEVEAVFTLREALESGEDYDLPAVVRPHILAMLREANLPRPSAEAYKQLEAAFIDHLVKLSDLAAKRRGGDWAHRTDLISQETLSVESPPQAAKAAKRKLRELFNAYAQNKILNDGDNRATRRTLKAYRAIVEGFIELQGDLDVAEVGRETVAGFRAALAKLPAKGVGIRGLSASKLIAKAEAERLPRLSEPTIRNRIRAMSAVLTHGVRLGWLTENPIIAGGVGRAAAKAASKRQTGTGRRKDYTWDELRAIFSSPIYMQDGWTPPRADFGRAWFWLPLLMYYTGARREELAQLAASEVRQCKEGIWHVSILEVQGDDDTARGVKTTGSRRAIPLHADLIKRGFVDYVKSVPAGGQLFPALTANPVGYFGANFGKRWANYLRDVVKLGSTASPSHGFRHAFKTLCRGAGIPEDVHDAITGHTGAAGAARAYGSMPLSVMARELQKFPVAPLPELEN